VELAPEKHPATLIMPIFDQPRLLRPPDEPEPKGYTMWLAIPDRDTLNLVERHGAASMKLGTFEFLSFCRLLAKISHAAAYAHRGFRDLFEPLLPDFILGKSEDYRDFVGGNSQRFNEPEEMAFPMFFESVDIGDLRYLVAQLRLFAYQATPVYRVVVGRRNVVQTLKDN
jgi:hypothetical protein